METQQNICWKSVLQDTGTWILDKTGPFLHYSIVSFGKTLACSKEPKNKELQNNNSDTYFFAYKIKTNYFMTKTIVVWTFRKFFFLQFDTKFASKQQRLAKIDTILWLLLSTQILQVWLTTGKIRGRKGQYYQAHMPRSWPLSTTARFATKGGLIQIQTGMNWWRKWMENHFQQGRSRIFWSQWIKLNLSFIFNTRNC